LKRNTGNEKKTQEKQNSKFEKGKVKGSRKEETWVVNWI
jgi:hypothetical protein